MRNTEKNRRFRLVFGTIFVCFFFLLNFAKISYSAGFVTDISGLFNFVNNNILGQLKKDFCNNYIISVSNGDWKEGEFRTNLGKNICTGYSVTNTTEKIPTVSVPKTTETPSISKTNIVNKAPVINPTPEPIVGSSTNGTDLNSGLILYWTNIERSNNGTGLVNLKQNNVLENIAQIRVKDMFAKGYFEHNSPTGDNASKEAAKNGYTYITIGENIALGNFGGSRELVTAWMNSPGHRANILNKNYTEIGVYAEHGMYNGQSVWIAAQIFGKPLAGCSQPDPALKEKIAKYKISANDLLTQIKAIEAELKTMDSSNVISYNQKAAEHNSLATLYNNLAAEIKKSTAEYNTQVSVFNTCIKTN